MAEDLATLGLSVNASGFKEAIEFLSQFRGSAISAEEGAVKLIAAMQKVGLTVPLMKVGLKQAVDAEDIKLVEQTKEAIDTLGLAYQITGGSASQASGPLRTAAEAVGVAINAIGRGNAADIEVFNDQIDNMAEAFAAANKQATLLVSGAIREIGRGNTADIEAFNDQIDSMSEAFAAANKQATLLVSGAIREIGRGNTADIEAFNAQIRSMGKAFEDVNKQATLLVAGAIREIGRGETADIEQFNAQMTNMHTAFEDVDKTATLAAAGGIREFGKSLEDADDTVSNRLLPTMSLFRYYMAFEIARGLVEMGSNVLEAGERLRELSDTAGLTTDAFQKLSYAALQVGIDTDKFSTFFDFLDRAIGSAQHGAPAVVDAFHDIGISFDDLWKKNPEQIFYAMADGMAKMTAQQRELALTQLGGRGGKQFGVLFGPEGSAGIKRTGKDAAVLTDEDVKTSQDFTIAARSAWNEMSVGVEKYSLAVESKLLAIGRSPFMKVIGDNLGAMNTFLHEHDLSLPPPDESIPATFGHALGHEGSPASAHAGASTLAGPPNPATDVSALGRKEFISETETEIAKQHEFTAAIDKGGAHAAIVAEKYKLLASAQKNGLEVTIDSSGKVQGNPADVRAFTNEYTRAGNADFETQQTKKDQNKPLYSGTETLQDQIKALEGQNRAALKGADALAAYNAQQQIWKELATTLGPLTAAQVAEYTPLVNKIGELKSGQKDLISQAAELKKVLESAGGNSADAARIAELHTLIQLQKQIDTPGGAAALGIDPAQVATVQEELHGMIEDLSQAKSAQLDWTESAKTDSDIFVHSFDQMGDSLDSFFNKLGEHTKHGQTDMQMLQGEGLKLAQSVGKFTFDTTVVDPARHATESLLHPYFPNLVPGPPAPNTMNNSRSGAPDSTNPFGGGSGFRGMASDATGALGLTKLSNWLKPSTPNATATVATDPLITAITANKVSLDANTAALGGKVPTSTGTTAGGSASTGTTAGGSAGASPNPATSALNPATTTPTTASPPIDPSAAPGTPGSSAGLGSHALPGATPTTVGSAADYVANIGTGGGIGAHRFSTSGAATSALSSSLKGPATNALSSATSSFMPAAAPSAAPGVTATGPLGATYAVDANGNLVATNLMGSISNGASAVGSAASSAGTAISSGASSAGTALSTGASSAMSSLADIFASFDEGAWELGKDQLANVHKGEMIIPRGPADALRNGLGAAAARERSDVRSVGSNYTTGGGRDKSSPTYNQITIQANDAGSFHASKRQTMADLSSAMHKSRR